ncbi:hypothetical protein TUM20286_48340 [Pseudomonas tohonis]|uniref:Uncharacterized protein n=1 Tax=Pseudomonas tohonis TaxID=2725477 RepID=A0ABQ4W6J8_9PSED|nr:hypothetical protein TUM20286_48340 [Pseudomonas tohonis]
MAPISQHLEHPLTSNQQQAIPRLTSHTPSGDIYPSPQTGRFMSSVTVPEMNQPGITQDRGNRAMRHVLSLTCLLPEQLDSFPGTKMAKRTTAQPICYGDTPAAA